MPIDEATLASGTPRTLDGREYPQHLRVYEHYDAPLLALAAQLPKPFTFDDLAASTASEPKLRDVLPRWVASAEWRRLLQRDEPSMRSPRAYELTKHGLRRLEQLRAHHAA